MKGGVRPVQEEHFFIFFPSLPGVWPRAWSTRWLSWVVWNEKGGLIWWRAGGDMQKGSREVREQKSVVKKISPPIKIACTKVSFMSNDTYIHTTFMRMQTTVNKWLMGSCQGGGIFSDFFFKFFLPFYTLFKLFQRACINYINQNSNEAVSQ